MLVAATGPLLLLIQQFYCSWWLITLRYY